MEHPIKAALTIIGVGFLQKFSFPTIEEARTIRDRLLPLIGKPSTFRINNFGAETDILLDKIISIQVIDLEEDRRLGEQIAPFAKEQNERLAVASLRRE